MFRPPGSLALAVIFALLALNAWAQVVLVPLGRSDDPLALSGLQALVGSAAAAVAYGSWHGSRWAPFAAVAYGVGTAGLLLALVPLLDLGAEARGGLAAAAATVLLAGLAAAWYLHRRRAALEPGSSRAER